MTIKRLLKFFPLSFVEGQLFFAYTSSASRKHPYVLGIDR